MNPYTLGAAGGIFALLAFAHFVIDWVFQSHKEAMKKSSDWRWRAKHCFSYAGGFIPVMLVFHMDVWEIVAGWAILFCSHFIEDTYIPVFLWAKYIRQMPAICDVGLTSNGIDRQTKEKAAFKELFQTPLGLVLFLTIDQLIHLAFLFPIVYFALSPGSGI